MKMFIQFTVKSIQYILLQRFLLTVLLLIGLRLLWGFDFYQPVFIISNLATFASCAYWLFIIKDIHTEIKKRGDRESNIAFFTLKAALIFVGGSALTIVILNNQTLKFPTFLLLCGISYVLTLGAYLYKKHAANKKL